MNPETEHLPFSSLLHVYLFFSPGKEQLYLCFPFIKARIKAERGLKSRSWTAGSIFTGARRRGRRYAQDVLTSGSTVFRWSADQGEECLHWRRDRTVDLNGTQLMSSAFGHHNYKHPSSHYHHMSQDRTKDILCAATVYNKNTGYYNCV